MVNRGSEYEKINKNTKMRLEFVKRICSEQDSDAPYQKTIQILEDIGIERVTIADCNIVAYVCSLVSTR